MLHILNKNVNKRKEKILMSIDGQKNKIANFIQK